MEITLWKTHSKVGFDICTQKDVKMEMYLKPFFSMISIKVTMNMLSQ